MKYTFLSFLLSSFTLFSFGQERIESLSDHSLNQVFTKSIEEDRILLTELDSIKKNSEENAEVSIEDLAILRRMKSVTKTIPLEYNAKVKYYIDKYSSKNYRPYMNRLLGLSKHYFSVYDRVFEELQLPNEIKYLSLVESSLNPHLVSTSGAVGPWQFIYSTARIYDLDMNAHIDERKDIQASTYAVSKYLQESYNQFNDWLLALASYNCGRGCVQRAIKRSGMDNPSYWELSPFLPKETQNYIPKYVAMTYVMNNASYYDIQPVATELDYETKLVRIDKAIDLREVAKALDFDYEKLKHYNPAFKKNIVSGSADKPRHLYLPLTPGLNDSLLYTALNTPTSLINVKESESLLADEASPNKIKKYVVRRGESLASVSRKFGVTVQDLKAWNSLKNSSVVGKTLIVSKDVDQRLVKNIEKSTSSSKSSSKSRTAYYIVKKGDSLDRIAKKTNSTVSKLKSENGLKNSVIKPGMKLKI